MRILSVNIGAVREVEHNGEIIRTAIFKSPVSGGVRLTRLGLAGDQQADTKHHGGEQMAAYCYSAQTYDYWRAQLAGKELPFGKLGENLAIDGLDDDSVHIGDTFRIGDPTRGVVVQASLPRAPCFKLGIVMNAPEFVKTFLHALKLGWYVRVLREGEVCAGDEVVRLETDPARLSITEVSRLRFFEPDNLAGAARAAAVEALAPTWRQMFSKRIAEAASNEPRP